MALSFRPAGPCPLSCLLMGASAVADCIIRITSVGSTAGAPPAVATHATRDCHDLAHLFSFFLSTGGSPEDFRAAVSELVATLTRPADDDRQVGRAVRFEDEWGALVTGAAKPSVGEVVWLFLRTPRAWRDVTVTGVVDGRPGSWRVHQRFRR